jgi:hypothetical protein
MAKEFPKCMLKPSMNFIQFLFSEHSAPPPPNNDPVLIYLQLY